MPVSEETYQRVALEDPDEKWELNCGRLRRKPDMTAEHNRLFRVLGYVIQRQLDLDQYHVAVDNAKVRRSPGRFFIPDVAVIPVRLLDRLLARTGTFEVYDDPLPFIAEVWSPSTGDYDVEEKFEVYKRRGDLEIWRIHPYERMVTAWRRQPDGSYAESVHRSGRVRLAFLPNVTIDLDALFG